MRAVSFVGLTASRVVPVKGRGNAYGSLRSVLAGAAFSRALQFSGSVIVARLLAPQELGRFVLVASVLGMIELMSQPGLNQALIQGHERDDRAWQSVWNLGVARGIVVSVALFELSDTLAELLRAPEISGLLQAVALVPLLRSMQSLSLVRAQRNVDLSPVVRLGVVGQLVGTVTSIVAVAMTRSAWGLVIGLMVSTTFAVVTSYLVPGFKPGLAFSVKAIRELFRYGRWRFLSAALWWASTQADNLIVGRSLGTRSLGLYGVAFGLAQMPTKAVTDVAAQVVFPAFSRAHRRSQARTRELFHEYLLVTAGVSGLIAALLAGAASPLVHALLGDAYDGAIVPLIVMAGAGFLRAIAATGGALFSSVGRPVFDTAMQALRAGALVGGLVFLVQFGVAGAAVASLCSIVAILPAWALGLSKVGVAPTSAICTVARRIPAAGLAGTATALAASTIGAPLPALVLALAVGLAVWVSATALVDRPLLRQLLSVMPRILRRRPPLVD